MNMVASLLGLARPAACCKLVSLYQPNVAQPTKPRLRRTRAPVSLGMPTTPLQTHHVPLCCTQGASHGSRSPTTSRTSRRSHTWHWLVVSQAHRQRYCGVSTAHTHISAKPRRSKPDRAQATAHCIAQAICSPRHDCVSAAAHEYAGWQLLDICNGYVQHIRAGLGGHARQHSCHAAACSFKACPVRNCLALQRKGPAHTGLMRATFMYEWQWPSYKGRLGKIVIRVFVEVQCLGCSPGLPHVVGLTHKKMPCCSASLRHRAASRLPQLRGAAPEPR